MHFNEYKHQLNNRGRRIRSRCASAGRGLGDGYPRSVFAGWGPVLFQAMGWNEQEEGWARA